MPPEHDPGPIFRLGDRVRLGNDRRDFGLIVAKRGNDGGFAYSVAWVRSKVISPHAEQDLLPA